MKRVQEHVSPVSVVDRCIDVAGSKIFIDASASWEEVNVVPRGRKDTVGEATGGDLAQCHYSPLEGRRLKLDNDRKLGRASPRVMDAVARRDLLSRRASIRGAAPVQFAPVEPHVTYLFRKFLPSRLNFRPERRIEMLKQRTVHRTPSVCADAPLILRAHRWFSEVSVDPLEHGEIAVEGAGAEAKRSPQ